MARVGRGQSGTHFASAFERGDETGKAPSRAEFEHVLPVATALTTTQERVGVEFEEPGERDRGRVQNVTWRSRDGYQTSPREGASTTTRH